MLICLKEQLEFIFYNYEKTNSNITIYSIIGS